MRQTFVFLAVLAAVGLPACGGGGDDDTGGGDGGGPGRDGAGPAGDGATILPDAAPPSSAGARVFATDVLHRVDITVAGGDLGTLDDDTSVRVPCTITIDGETVTGAGIRKKGQTSQRPLSEKPSFSVKVNEFTPGLKLDGLKKLALDAYVQDDSLLVGHLGYEVYRRVGIPAPRTSHGVVTFNGEVKGLYVLEEAINTDFLQNAYGDANGQGNLYEGPWDFRQGAGAMELKDEVEEGRSRADLEALTAVVDDAATGDLAAALAPLIDVDQFIVNYAVEVVALHWDSYAYAAWNYYLYHRPDTDKFVILPHGVNWPYWHADVDPYDLYVYPWGDGTPPGQLCERLRDVPTLDAAFHDAVENVTAVGWDVPTLLGRIDQVETVLHSVPAAGGRWADDLADFDANVDDARAFVRDRKTYLDAR